jgi:hypothetical protein
MAKRRTRKKSSLSLGRFFFTVTSGVLTGLISFFTTNCLLPPGFIAQVQAFVWQPRQGPELVQASPAPAILAEFDSDAAGADDSNTLQCKEPSINFRTVQVGTVLKDAVTTHTIAAKLAKGSSSVTANYSPSGDGVWRPVFGGAAPP